MYATKRRRRSVKTVKPPMKDPPKSNPSKRHRERLNSELDHLASLLPFEQSVISKLDKLSILRLAVSYLRTKSYFQASLQERYAREGRHHLISHNHHLYAEPAFTDTDCVLQALSGFLFAVSSDGEVFFASRTVEQYLGFHQSDIIHQSALELIHSEDRDEFKSQLSWRSRLAQDQADMTIQQVLMPENAHLLHRCFTVRFRCLLDNTSGFITLEISGRFKVLLGQAMKSDEPPLAMFALCCPFGPLPLLDVPPRDYTFKSKHKMDMSPISMDPRGKMLFGYVEAELAEKGGYDLIHPDDLTYYAAAHEELIKTGSSGLIAYRLTTKDFQWIWLQSSTKVTYKNSKPDYVIATHRHLTEDEGRELVGKRGNEFKLPYPIIDSDPTGLGSTLEEEELGKLKSSRNKKSKTQLRDYLQAGRKRKTPYREVYPTLNGYNPYLSLNGYPSCQTAGDVKAELMYPYSGGNFALDSDLYRTGYHTFAGSMYPGTDGLRLDADKHSYTNGYYLEPRQYQHTLQYHGNGYSDLMAQTSKYGYDVAKFSYCDPMSSYGLDLTKRGHYEDEISRYESDLRKYAAYSGYTAAEKVSRINGTYDALRSDGSLENGRDNLMSCGSGVPHNTSPPCSLYRPDTTNGATIDRYAERESTLKLVSSSSMQPPGGDCSKQAALPLNAHMSVIRLASPRTKSPRTNATSLYNIDTECSASLSADCSAATWPTCRKSANQCNKASPAEHGASPVLQQPMATTEIVSCIVQPNVNKQNSAAAELSSVITNGNGVLTAPTSVIQQPLSRNRSCDKEQPISESIAIPIVKSSSWVHNLPAASYDWHLSASDAYMCHQRALRGDSFATDSVVGATHPRTIMETPKVACFSESW